MKTYPTGLMMYFDDREIHPIYILLDLTKKTGGWIKEMKEFPEYQFHIELGVYGQVWLTGLNKKTDMVETVSVEAAHNIDHLSAMVVKAMRWLYENN